MTGILNLGSIAAKTVCACEAEGKESDGIYMYLRKPNNLSYTLMGNESVTQLKTTCSQRTENK